MSCNAIEVVNIPGSPGTNGINAFASTVSTFLTVVPGGSVTVTVDNSSMFATGSYVAVATSNGFGGTPYGIYLITSNQANVLIMTYTGVPSTVIGGITVPIGSLVAPTGQPSTLPLPVALAYGGTGQSVINNAALLTAIGAAASGVNSDITALSALAIPIPTGVGGTGGSYGSLTAIMTALAATLHTGTIIANGATAVVKADANVTASTVIIFTLKTVGGTPAGAPYCSAITPTTGFSMKAAAGDTSTYNYCFIN